MKPGQRIRVKNWSKFQHYKDRSPPWIKLYNELLENYAWSCLQDASKAHLIGIWMLASRSEDDLPADPRWLAGKISASETIDLTPLVSAGFIEVYDPASNLLADCKQNAIPERETEAEKEAEEKQPREAREFSTSMEVGGPDGSDMPHPGSRMAASELVHLWASHIQPTPTQADRARQKPAAMRITTHYSKDEIVAALVGMTALFPHAPPPRGKSEPWDLHDLSRKFAKARAKALDHPEIRAQNFNHAFMEAAS